MKGSHNTLTYAGPARWWGRLCVPVWRCQRKNVREQIEAGCRAFDIRFSLKAAGNGVEDMWEGAHGLVRLRVNPVKAEGSLVQRCGSMSGTWWGKVLPGFWARLHRGEMVAAEDREGLPVVLRDMVGN